MLELNLSKFDQVPDTNEATLIRAIIAGDIHKVRDLLRCGVNLESSIQNDSHTALMWAADYGSTEIVQLLLKKGANLHAKSKHGETPLFYAAEKGYHEIVELLIEHGALVNIKDAFEMTPLHHAIRAAKKDMVSLLLDLGADINLQNYDKASPLLYAIDEGHPEIVQVLLERGADPNLSDELGMTPLITAANNGDDDLVCSLIQHGANLDLEDYSEKTALDYAKMYHHERIVEILCYMQALFYASKHKNFDLARKFAGQDINYKDSYDKTLLHYAIDFEEVDIVRFILSKKPNLYQKYENSPDLKAYAAQIHKERKTKESAEITKLLVNFKKELHADTASPSQKNMQSHTAVSCLDGLIHKKNTSPTFGLGN